MSKVKEAKNPAIKPKDAKPVMFPHPKDTIITPKPARSVLLKPKPLKDDFNL